MPCMTHPDTPSIYGNSAPFTAGVRRMQVSLQEFVRGCGDANATPASALSLIDRIALLEQSALGEQSQGGAVPRVAALEEAVLGAVSAGGLPDRVKALEVAMGM